MGELGLIGLRGFQVQRIVNGHGNLAGDSLHELELAFGDALRNQTPKAHGPQPALCSGQWKQRERTHAFLAKALHELRITVFFRGVTNHKSFLRLPDPAGRMAIHSGFRTQSFFVRDARLQDMQTHDVARRVVQGKGEKIEIDDRVQAFREIVEQRREIALLRDGLADFQQGFELLARVFRRRRRRRFRRSNDRVRHNWQDSTRVGGGSTKRLSPGQSLKLARTRIKIWSRIVRW